jgi:hypothetical protein
VETGDVVEEDDGDGEANVQQFDDVFGDSSGVLPPAAKIRDVKVVSLGAGGRLQEIRRHGLALTMNFVTHHLKVSLGAGGFRKGSDGKGWKKIDVPVIGMVHVAVPWILSPKTVITTNVKGRKY